MGTHSWSFDALVDELRGASEGFSVPCLLDGEHALQSIHEEELAEALRRSPEVVFAYGDGGTRLDFRERALCDPPRPGEGLRAWSQRLFGDQRFGVLVQRIESVQETLARRFARMLAPLVEGLGRPHSGVAVNFFVGDYGLTPFGIHHDSEMEIFHLHLGPGPKTLRLWEPERWRSIYGSSDYCHTPEPWLSSADYVLRLSRGGVLYLPGRCYHIGDAREFSVVVILVFCSGPRSQVLQGSLNQALRMCWPDDLASVELEPSGVELEHPLLSEETPRSMRSWSVANVRLLQALLRSNGWLSSPPREIDVDEGALASTRWIRRVEPFPIEVLEYEEKLAVVARRRTHLVPPAPEVYEAVKALQEREVVELPAWRHALARGIGSVAVERLLKALLRGRALEFVEESLSDDRAPR